jgi:YVTN family beta-propeller protein
VTKRGAAMRFATAAALALAAIAMPESASATATLPAYTSTQIAGVSNVRDIAVDPAMHRIYAADEQDDSIVVVDATTQLVVATIFLPAEPFSIAIDPATHRLFAVGFQIVQKIPTVDAYSLFVVDTTANAVIATTALPGP